MLSRLGHHHRSAISPAFAQLVTPSVILRRSLLARAMSSTATAPFIVMDAFCLRSFTSSHSSSTHINSSADDFVQRVNAQYQQQLTSGSSEAAVLREGYAPFCKHIFMPNHLPDLHSAYLPITDDNRQHLQSATKSHTASSLLSTSPVADSSHRCHVCCRVVGAGMWLVLRRSCLC